MRNSHEKICRFYDQLKHILRAILNTENIILLGDFNANHIILSLKVLVILERGRLIPMAIHCYPFAWKIIWSKPTSKKNTPGFTQHPDTGTSLILSSRVSVICHIS